LAACGSGPGRPGHLELCRPSISKVGPSISLYYDIEGAIFDIEDRKTTFDIGYNMTSRYRVFRLSICIASIVRNFDIAGCNLRYRTSMIFKNFLYRSLELRYRRRFDAVRYRRNIDIEVQNFDVGNLIVISRNQDLLISTNAPSISVYDIEALCFETEFCVLRYRCFFAWATVAPARYWKQIAEFTIYCASSVR
jgi:hypothetical protein